MDSQAQPFEPLMREHSMTELCITAKIGGKECRLGSGMKGFAQAALLQRAMESHELQHAPLRCEFCIQSRSIEVDDDDFAGGSRSTDQQILDLEIGVAASQIVKSAHGRPRGARRPLERSAVGIRFQVRNPVHRPVFVNTSNRRLPEPAPASPHDEARLRNRRTASRERGGGLKLRNWPLETREARSREARQDSAVDQGSNVESSRGSRKIEYRVAPAALNRRRSRSQRAQVFVLFESQRTRGLLEGRCDFFGDDHPPRSDREFAKRVEVGGFSCGHSYHRIVASSSLSLIPLTRSIVRASERSALCELSYRSDPVSARLFIIHCLNPLSLPPRAGRILIIRLGALGDVVRTLPALMALRAAYPGAHISWLTERAAAGVLDGHDGLDRVIVFPREALGEALRKRRFAALRRSLGEFVKALRAERFDLVIDFHAILKSGIISRLSGAPIRVSYAWPEGREFSWMFANQRARLSPEKRSRYDRNAGLIEFLAIDPEVQNSSLKVDETARRRVARELAGGEAPILLHPGTSGGASYKRYRPSGYAALARELKRRRGLDSIVSTGATAEERSLAEQIVVASDGAARLAPETPELTDLIALIESACLFVGSDSGPLHIATSIGTPAVQILGPTDPIENEPRRGSRWERVQIRVPCSPCRRGCAPATCMSIIPHELVLDAALACLGQTSEPRSAPRVSPSRIEPMAVSQPWS